MYGNFRLVLVTISTMHLEKKPLLWHLGSYFVVFIVNSRYEIYYMVVLNSYFVRRYWKKKKIVDQYS